jgi:hypothetical protein
MHTLNEEIIDLWKLLHKHKARYLTQSLMKYL